MNRKMTCMAVFSAILLSLSGCGPIGSKSASLAVVYGAAAVLSLLLLICYACTRKRDPWLLLLFVSVAVVNTGYFALAVSSTLESALWANRLAYFGSVFLPLSMLMSILKAANMPCQKWLRAALFALSAVMFLLAASPGYLTVYYRSVSLVSVNGVSMLQKEYGPLHCLYLIYLLLYLVATVAVTLFALLRKKLETPAHAVMLASAVGVNIGVWLLEQLVDINFEFLSVSYLISEVFLLVLHLMIAENERRLSAATAALQAELSAAQQTQPAAQEPSSPYPAEQRERFFANLTNLTRTERVIYDFYVSGKSTKEVLAALEIKENTLKFHNKNIYGKLGVSSRRQLVDLSRTQPPADTKTD